MSTHQLFGLDKPHLPDELVLVILNYSCPEYFHWFRLYRVNTEWRDYILDTSPFRELMFLPNVSSTEDPIILSSSLEPNEAVMHIHWALPNRLWMECGGGNVLQKYLGGKMAPPWPSVTMHPLLEESLTRLRIRKDDNEEQSESNLSISYQLVKYLNQPQFQNASATWRQMLITQPPLERLSLHVKEWDCNTISRAQDTIKDLRNPTGVTLGDVFDAVWQTRLPRNVGLVPNIPLCLGPKRPHYLGQRCRCYHANKSEEKLYESRMADLEWKREKFEATVVKSEDKTIDGRASNDVVVQVSGKAKYAKFRVVLEMEDGEWKAKVERERGFDVLGLSMFS